MNNKNNIVLRMDNNKNLENESNFLRLIFVGDTGVGKTQIINIYNNKLFQNEHFPTFSIDIQIKILNINGKKTKIHCIDAEGSKDISETVGKLFIKKADAFIIIYDITSRESFINIYKYVDYFKFALNNVERKYSNKIKYIVGNKYDLRTSRLISEIKGREMPNKYYAKYMECSAKNGLNVDWLFEYIIQDISRREESNSSDSGGNQKNNRIYKNVNSIRSNDSLKNNNRNGLYSDNESRQNFETSSYFLKSRNYINSNNDYINNINNFQSNK